MMWGSKSLRRKNGNEINDSDGIKMKFKLKWGTKEIVAQTSGVHISVDELLVKHYLTSKSWLSLNWIVFDSGFSLSFTGTK